MANEPPVLGIVGGVASGKSTVAQMFAALGAAVVDADRIGHDVLETDAVRDELVRRWGRQILNGTGSIDRQKVADLVFGEPKRLAELNVIVHPAICRRIAEQIERIRREQRRRLIVLDAALLMEANLQTWCDALVFVEAPDAQRNRRARDERGWAPDELARRESGQMPPHAKRRQADSVIDNGGTLEQTKERVKGLDRRWVRT